MKDIVRRVGQRFMVGFEGLTASADVKALIREFGVGHVVLFARNVAGPEQVADLVRELQSVARDAGLEPAADRRGPGGRPGGSPEGAVDDLALGPGGGSHRGRGDGPRQWAPPSPRS